MGNLVNIAKAAVLANVSRGTIYKAIADKQITVNEEYGLMLVDEEQVKQFAETVRKYTYNNRIKKQN